MNRRNHSTYKTIASLILITLLPSHSLAAVPAPVTAKDTIQNFYQKYLNYNYHKTPNLAVPELKFSTSFTEEVARNLEICEKYVAGICGWAAEGNEYLDTQESDPNLSYKNSGIKITETSTNIIRVTLNVYPSIENTDNYYIKTITYKMIFENNQWVVDDINYTNGLSSRKIMEDQDVATLASADKNINSGK